MLSVIGSDRLGIVSAITGVLEKEGCNLLDTAMTKLLDNFAMLVSFSSERRSALASLESAIEEVASELGLRFQLVVAGETSDEFADSSEMMVLSIHGADRPGIVHGVCAVLAQLGVNIEDLSSKIVDGDSGAVYVMVAELSVPRDIDGALLHDRLRNSAETLGVQFSLSVAETTEL